MAKKKQPNRAKESGVTVFDADNPTITSPLEGGVVGTTFTASGTVTPDDTTVCAVVIDTTTNASIQGTPGSMTGPNWSFTFTGLTPGTAYLLEVQSTDGTLSTTKDITTSSVAINGQPTVTTRIISVQGTVSPPNARVSAILFQPPTSPGNPTVKVQPNQKSVQGTTAGVVNFQFN